LGENVTVTWRKRAMALACTAAATTLVIAGCSGSDDDSDDGAADTAVLGEAKAASGDPIELVLNTTGDKAPAYTHETEVANATVSYINDYLGGISGRPVKLTICYDDIQAAKARECANKAVGSPAVAVLGGSPSNPDSVTAVTSPAAMPYFIAVGGGQTTLLQPNSYALSNSVGGLLGQPVYIAKEKGVSKVAVLVIDAPIATTPFTSLGGIVKANSGVELEVVAVPPGTADMTPFVQSAVKSGAGQIHLVGDEAFCTPIFKAIASLGVDLPITALSNCVSEDGAEQVPGGYPEADVLVTANRDPESEDYKVFQAVLDKYGVDDDKEDGVTAYWAILSLQRALDGMTGEISRETIIDRLNTMSEPVVIPMMNGKTFQCGTKPMPITPNVCSGGILSAALKSDGDIGEVNSLDVASYFTMPGQ
jgi:branched-chain amino acid transport system substrate-binding protein